MENSTDHFARLDRLDFPPFEAGSVWLVGAGPGAPGLISLLAYHGLAQAEVIIYDALVNPELLDMAAPKAKKIYAGKRGGRPSARQANISLTLVEQALAGKKVLRLKGGDPFVFGRGGEECLALAKAGIRFRIVPGITAGIGGLAYAGIPVTQRETNHAVIFLTGHDENGSLPHGVDWPAIATAAPVIVMYMAMKHLNSICTRLMDAGRGPDDRLAIVSNASLPQQSVVETTLKQASNVVKNINIATPAIVVVGPVSQYREVLDWYTNDLRGNSLG